MAVKFNFTRVIRRFQKKKNKYLCKFDFSSAQSYVEINSTLIFSTFLKWDKDKWITEINKGHLYFNNLIKITLNFVDIYARKSFQFNNCYPSKFDDILVINVYCWFINAVADRTTRITFCAYINISWICDISTYPKCRIVPPLALMWNKFVIYIKRKICCVL